MFSYIFFGSGFFGAYFALDMCRGLQIAIEFLRIAVRFTKLYKCPRQMRPKEATAIEYITKHGGAGYRQMQRVFIQPSVRFSRITLQ